MFTSEDTRPLLAAFCILSKLVQPYSESVLGGLRKERCTGSYEIRSLLPAISLCAIGFALLGGSLIVGRNTVNGTDFLPFYAGARLVGTGRMYDAQSVWSAQLAAMGKYGPSLLFIRMPCFALFLWPLAQLPYTIARHLWMILQIFAVFAAVWLWPGSRKTALIVTCWSLPVLMCLADGTDTALIFFWLVVWRRLESRNHPVAAGMALAFCAAKFHLFLFFPLLLLFHRRWLVLKGSAIGLSVLLILSFAAGGWDWPIQYYHVLQKPLLDPGKIAPNIHGLVSGSLPGLEIPLIVVAALLTIAAMIKLDYPDAIAAALAGGLLCSFHSYVMDGVFLLPGIISMIERHKARWPGLIASALATPMPWAVVLLRWR